MSIRRIVFSLVSPIWVRIYLYNFSNSLANPRRYYGYCTVYFKLYLNQAIRNQRIYFGQDRRSFGEDPFTVMWYLLYKKFNFKNFLEIGVYQGQVLNLISLLARLNNKEMLVWGISPLTDANDSVSSYIKIDYEKQMQQHFEFIGVKQPRLTKAYSTDPEAIKAISSVVWDCIYIDGSHDYEIVKQDYLNTYPNLRKGGILIFDDASLNLSSASFYGLFKGHPGPSDFVDETVKTQMKEILRVGHNRCFLKIN